MEALEVILRSSGLALSLRLSGEIETENGPKQRRKDGTGHCHWSVGGFQEEGLTGMIFTGCVEVPQNGNHQHTCPVHRGSHERNLPLGKRSPHPTSSHAFPAAEAFPGILKAEAFAMAFLLLTPSSQRQ